MCPAQPACQQGVAGPSAVAWPDHATRTEVPCSEPAHSRCHAPCSHQAVTLPRSPSTARLPAAGACSASCSCHSPRASSAEPSAKARDPAACLACPCVVRGAGQGVHAWAMRLAVGPCRAAPQGHVHISPSHMACMGWSLCSRSHVTSTDGYKRGGQLRAALGCSADKLARSGYNSTVDCLQVRG